MRMFTLVRGIFGIAATLATCWAGAATLVVGFPEITDPPKFSVDDLFPAPPLTVGTVKFEIPPGQKVVAAQISGFWGSSLIPEATAGVDVLVDGILVAQCVKPAVGCYELGSGQRPWSYVFTDAELAQLADGEAKMTAVQTSDVTVRLGRSTLFIQTGPAETIPALSLFGLLSLMAGLAAAGALALRRMARA